MRKILNGVKLLTENAGFLRPADAVTRKMG